jgi:hypothetical protein
MISNTVMKKQTAVKYDTLRAEITVIFYTVGTHVMKEVMDTQIGFYWFRSTTCGCTWFLQ